LSFTHAVLAIIGSNPIGCHGIPVSPEDPPLGTLYRAGILPPFFFLASRRHEFDFAEALYVISFR